MLVQWAQSDNVKSRLFAMYLFEVLADCHLAPEQLTVHKDSFMSIFSSMLQDKDVSVRVAALKATTSFLTSIDDSDLALSYASVLPTLLSTVVDSLKSNEEQGR